MDPQSFDSLTRLLAAAKTRRGLLGSLAALGAGLLGARGAGAQVTQARCGTVACRTNPGRCAAGCVCCVWSNGNTRCTPPGLCSGTPTCPAGRVPDPVGGCVAPTTTTTTAPPVGCVSSAQCAAGNACFNGGCFQVCGAGSFDCSQCGCTCTGLHEHRDGTNYCLDQGTFVGVCRADTDCPRGSACSVLSNGVANLCTRPCLCGGTGGT